MTKVVITAKKVPNFMIEFMFHHIGICTHQGPRKHLKVGWASSSMNLTHDEKAIIHEKILGSGATS